MGQITPPRPLEETDDRAQFDCGRETLNNWLVRHAWRNHKDGVSRTYVIEGSEPRQIAGYVTLSTGSIERAFVSKRDQRNKPDPLPIILLGQLAVDQAYQGKGYARSLLQFALQTAVNLTELVGGYGVLTHPLDDQIRGFYRSWGFEDLPFDPKRAMFVRIVDLKHNGFEVKNHV